MKFIYIKSNYHSDRRIGLLTQGSSHKTVGIIIHFRDSKLIVDWGKDA